MGDSEDREDLPGYVNDPQEPEDNIEDNIESYSDSVSFFIYDKDDEHDNSWIRSTVTIEQTEDDEGFEEIDPKLWKGEEEES